MNNKPPNGKARTVLLTRPEHQQKPLRLLFHEAGAIVLSQPTIEIRAPRCWNRVDEVLRRLETFDWIVFASRNGVDFFCERFSSLFERKYRDFCSSVKQKVCAIGPGTTTALQQQGICVDRIPVQHTAEGIVEALATEAEQGRRILLIRADRGRNVMFEELSAAHCDSGGIEEIAVYQSVDIADPFPEILDRMRQAEIDWTTCTSSSIAVSLVRMFGESLRNTKIASISPITTQTLTELGHQVAAESETATINALFKTVQRKW